jgi:flagellar motor switch protein FliG
MAEAGATGTDRAAILLLTLGEEPAASILRHLGAEEVQRLGAAMARMSDVTRDQVGTVLGDLLTTVSDKASLGVDTEHYLRKILTSSFGERSAGNFLGRIFQKKGSKGLETLKWMDARAVAEMIRAEHPQIVATILAHLSASQAAQVLSQFPVEQQSNVAMRVARLEEVSETALDELDSIVDQQTQEAESLRSARVGGIRVAADIINLLDDKESSVLDAIMADDHELGEKIKDSLFVFENLLSIDDRGIQTLLRSVQTDTLSVALKAADNAIQEKIFRNMSKRAAEILKDDMAAKGPVRLSDVEEAQKEILLTVQQLAEEGQIMLGGRGEQFV